MFSTVKALILSSIIVLTGVAHAETVPVLSFGKYKLTSGDDLICNEIDMQKRDLRDKNLRVGIDIMPIVNEDVRMQSDLDANCEFTQKSTRTDDASSTTLVRIDNEICQGQVKSDSMTTVKITSSTITVSYKRDGSDLGTCVYTK
ncbi:hypothetical protein [Bdellovibrio sp. HCB209]|uniref:hypothetical protein n=1 Tax=Bdellovibrio sp. HCB209 TaxID=3394354 RepID=UPI0039B5439D